MLYPKAGIVNTTLITNIILHTDLILMINFSIFCICKFLTVPAKGAGSLQTSYGKEVPMYSPSSGNYPSPMNPPTGFHKMFAMEFL